MKIILLFIMCILITGCGNFMLSKDHIVLTNSTIKNIEGKYKNIPFSVEHLNNSTSDFTEGKFIRELSRSLLKDTLLFDSTSSFELKVIDKKLLQVKNFKNGLYNSSQIVKYKIKNDGFLYLKNKNVKPILIPYIVGAINIQKVRISRNIRGNLIADVYNHRSGALLLIAFLNGKTTINRYLYEITE